MAPVSGADTADLRRLRADPRVFAVMLGGVRDTQRADEELAVEIRLWGSHGFGMWTVREADRIVGLTGLMLRADGRGVALRFAFWPEAQGRGLAREASTAALSFAHEEAGLPRVVAVAREDNFASRTLLGGIGMRPCEEFVRDGWRMLTYESQRIR